jgi:hypothetical protein
MFTHAILLGLSLGVQGCTPPTVSDSTSEYPRDTNVVIVYEDETGYDADPPDTVLVLMNEDSTWALRCLDMGGEPLKKGLAFCVDVDY